jgi:hypothetical protein
MTNDWTMRSKCSAKVAKSPSVRFAATQSTSNRRNIELANCKATSDVTSGVYALARSGAGSKLMCLSEGNHSRVVAMPSVTASTGSVMPDKWAANRSRKPVAARVAAASSRASVLVKYR